jgi:DNA-binding PadR family transcriptional regulator
MNKSSLESLILEVLKMSSRKFSVLELWKFLNSSHKKNLELPHSIPIGIGLFEMSKIRAMLPEKGVGLGIYYNAIRDLEQKGLVERIQVSGREKSIVLTEKGDIFSEVNRRLGSVLATFLTELGAEERIETERIAMALISKPKEQPKLRKLSEIQRKKFNLACQLLELTQKLVIPEYIGKNIYLGLLRKKNKTIIDVKMPNKKEVEELFSIME